MLRRHNILSAATNALKALGMVDRETESPTKLVPAHTSLSETPPSLGGRIRRRRRQRWVAVASPAPVKTSWH